MSGQQSGSAAASEVFQPLAADDPTMVAGYRLAARLGAGGMGKVYLSYTPGGRPVAVKVIRPEFGEDAEFRRRFAQEVRSAQRVQGLYTAPVIDADAEGAHPWLATAYVPGPSLADAVVTHGALPVETVLLLVAGMAEALQVIHGAGLVHRDLKPSNVLLAADGPRVIDFGIAHAADATSLTGSGVTIGTPAFMAPEQAAGSRVTPATDVFALGQVAAYAAAGLPAFGEGSSHGVLYRIVHEQPDLSAVPERLRELVTRCLAKDPAARPTVAEVIRLCQEANAATVLRRPEDWLPGAVSADITARAATPAPASPLPQAPPAPPAPPAHAPVQPPTQPPTQPSVQPSAQGLQHPATAPAVAYSPTAPAAPVTGPATGPVPAPPHAHGYAYAPTQGVGGPAPYATQYPGAPAPYPGQQPQAPAPRGNAGRRTLLVGLAAALVFGVGGAGLAYVLTQNDDRQSASGDNGKPSGSTGSASNGSSGGAQPHDKPSAKQEPKPMEFKSINLTAGYHLTLGDDVVRPQDGEDGGYELSYDTGGYLDAESTGGNLVLLDPGQEGSLATCRAETRFTEEVYVNKLSPGRQLCVTTGTGHLGLVTVKAFSPEGSPSTYMTLDLTVWRNAAASGSGS
ncbi:protein kinase [Streptomyces sp. NPDC101160]|uniref:serine/threonine-protein kinase n=1 Tax=Streptomyces sp. NPDC101160 TaxID=3366118 RepID=UPI003817BCDF